MPETKQTWDAMRIRVPTRVRWRKEAYVIIRSTRRLSVAIGLAAVFVAAAVPAAASATNPIRSAAATENTVLEGAQSGVVLEIPGGGEITCSSAIFSGTMKGREAKEVTLHPVYNKEEKTCLSPLGTAKITTAGCDFSFSGTPAKEESPGSIGISCEAGHSILITTALGCKVTIGSQTVSGFNYTNSSNWNNLTSAVNATGIHFTATETCGPAGIPSTGTNGVWKNNITIAGYEEEGGKKGRLTALRVGPVANMFRSESGTKNVVLQGTQNVQTFFKVGAIQFFCNAGTYTGQMGGAEQLASEAINLHPTYNNEEKTCGAGFKVSTTGCHYSFEGEVPSTGAQGAMAIGCDAGNSVQFTAYGCTVSFGPQAGIQSVKYSNVEPGGPDTRSVVFNVASSKIHYTASGGACASDGVAASGSDAEITSEFTVKSYKSIGGIPYGQTGFWVK